MLSAVHPPARVRRPVAAHDQRPQQRLGRQRRSARGVQPVVISHLIRAELRGHEPLAPAVKVVEYHRALRIADCRGAVCASTAVGVAARGINSRRLGCERRWVALNVAHLQATAELFQHRAPPPAVTGAAVPTKLAAVVALPRDVARVAEVRRAREDPAGDAHLASAAGPDVCTGFVRHRRLADAVEHRGRALPLGLHGHQHVDQVFRLNLIAVIFDA